MTDKCIYSIPLTEKFIPVLADNFLLKEAGNALSKKAVIFSGKRPVLHLNKYLADKLGGTFFPPGFFTVDEFVTYIYEKQNKDYRKVNPLDAVYILFEQIKASRVLDFPDKILEDFSSFYPWGQKIFNFINKVDTENIAPEKLQNVQALADIGYEDVPERINKLFQNIVTIRTKLHDYLRKHHLTTRGLIYLDVVDMINTISLDEFEEILFAGLFALTGCEKLIIKNLWQRGKTRVIWQGHPDTWSILKQLQEEVFLCEVAEIGPSAHAVQDIFFYSAFDMHSQVMHSNKILQNFGDYNNTAVVLPNSETLYPFLSLAIDRIDTEYNITLGYPLTRTALFSLVNAVISNQALSEKGKYHTKEYINLLLHPFIKNISFQNKYSSNLTRFLIYNIKKAFTGEIRDKDFNPLKIANQTFIRLEDILKEDRLFTETVKQLQNSDEKDVSEDILKILLSELHEKLFMVYEQTNTLKSLAEAFTDMLSYILEFSPVRSFVLSGEVYNRFFQLLDELQNLLTIGDMVFEKNMLMQFFISFLSDAVLSFSTRPLQGIQIMGMLETRNLSFDKLIFFDVNEGVLPQGKNIDPLIPLGILSALGLPDYEKTEEIYSYYFIRIVASAKESHFVFQESEDKRRSRYIEKLIWNFEKQKLPVHIEKIIYPVDMHFQTRELKITKSDKVIKKLNDLFYSASMMDQYLSCPLIFYFQNIARVEPNPEVAGEIEAGDRGILVHNILYQTLSGFIGQSFPENMAQVLPVFQKALEKEFQFKKDSGEYQLVKKIINLKLERYFSDQISKQEKRVIHGLEKKYSARMAINGHQLNFKGRFDRIDYYPEKEEYLIIDYKTGSEIGIKYCFKNSGSQFTTVEELVDSGLNTLQMPVYLLLFKDSMSLTDYSQVNGQYAFLLNNTEKVFFPEDNRNEIMTEYLRALNVIVMDIFNQDKPFARFENQDLTRCQNCVYARLCKII